MRTMKTEEILNTLRESGFRLTLQRRELLNIVESETQPLSIDEISERLKLSEGDLPTLYRNLNFFEEEKIFKRVFLNDGKVRYELSDLHRDHHHHLVCENCGAIEDLETCLPASFFSEIEQQGFVINDHSLELYGSCKDCVE